MSRSPDAAAFYESVMRRVARRRRRRRAVLLAGSVLGVSIAGLAVAFSPAAPPPMLGIADVIGGLVLMAACAIVWLGRD